MLTFARPALIGAAFLASAVAASAADIYEPPVVELPPPPVYEKDYGGWYIRGDVDYHLTGWRGADYITYGCPAPCVPSPNPGTNSFTTGKLRGAFSIGGGVGYQVNHYFRTDLTFDYFHNASFRGSTTGANCGGGGPCVSDDRSAYSALVMMANAYADLGTWHGVTPYVGAGIGGAYLDWKNLRNTFNGGTTTHFGANSMRFGWSLMAGASYCINRNLKFDLGYRYMRLAGGRMFEYQAPAGGGVGAGPGFDRGLNIHEARAGLRYQFGKGDDRCGAKHYAYAPPPEPLIFK